MKKDYIQCYFAFLDLLGFKEIVKTKTCSEIVEIFEEAKRQYIINRIIDGKTKIPVIPPEDIHYYVMSDSICIYIRDNIKAALPILVWLCMYLQARMLCFDTPIFIRGGISRGDIYEDHNILFGPAFVEAYLREEKLARAPRIVIPESLYEDVKDPTEKVMLCSSSHLEQDGFYTTNYIDYFCHHDSTLKYRANVVNYVRNMLNTSLDQSVREKYIYVKSWMDYYFAQEEVTAHGQ